MKKLAALCAVLLLTTGFGQADLISPSDILSPSITLTINFEGDSGTYTFDSPHAPNPTGVSPGSSISISADSSSICQTSGVTSCSMSYSIDGNSYSVNWNSEEDYSTTHKLSGSEDDDGETKDDNQKDSENNDGGDAVSGIDWSSEHNGVMYAFTGIPDSVTIGDTISLTAKAKRVEKQAHSTGPDAEFFVDGYRLGDIQFDPLGKGSTDTKSVTIKVTGNFRELPENAEDEAFELNPGPASFVMGNRGGAMSGYSLTSYQTKTINLQAPSSVSEDKLEISDWKTRGGRSPPGTLKIETKIRNNGPIPVIVSGASAGIVEDGISFSLSGETETCTTYPDGKDCTTIGGQTKILPGQEKNHIFPAEVTGEHLYKMGARLDTGGFQKEEIQASLNAEFEDSNVHTVSGTASKKFYNSFRFPWRSHAIDPIMADKFDKFHQYDIRVETDLGQRINKDSEELKIFTKWGKIEDHARVKNPGEKPVERSMIGHEDGKLILAYQEGSIGIHSKTIDLPSEPSELGTLNLKIPSETKCETNLNGKILSKKTSSHGRVLLKDETQKRGTEELPPEEDHKPYNREEKQEFENRSYSFYEDLKCGETHTISYQVKNKTNLSKWVEKANKTFKVPMKEPVNKNIDLFADGINGTKICNTHVENAQSRDGGEQCREASLKLQCPHTDRVYQAKNGCEINHLKNHEWSLADDKQSGKVEIHILPRQVKRGEDMKISVDAPEGKPLELVIESPSGEKEKRNFKGSKEIDISTENRKIGSYTIKLKSNSFSDNLLGLIAGLDLIEETRFQVMSDEPEDVAWSDWTSYCKENDYSTDNEEYSDRLDAYTACAQNIVDNCFNSDAGTTCTKERENGLSLRENLCSSLGYRYDTETHSCVSE